MGLEGTAAISKLPTEAAPRRAAGKHRSAPSQPDPPIPRTRGGNARARRHTQHQAQEAQQQNARGGDPRRPRGAAIGASASAATPPHLHAGAAQASTTLMSSALGHRLRNACPPASIPTRPPGPVGGDDAAESARAPRVRSTRPARPRSRSSPVPSAGAPSPSLRAVGGPTRTRRGRVDGVFRNRVASTTPSESRRVARESRVEFSRWHCSATNAGSRPTPRAAPLHHPARRPATPSLLYAPRTCWRTSA